MTRSVQALIGILSGAAMLVPGSAESAEMVSTDNRGAIQAFLVNEEYVPVRVNLYLPTPGWRSVLNLYQAKDVTTSSAAGRRAWSGRIEVEPGRFCRYEQMLQESPGGVVIGFTLTAESDLNLEGAYLWMDMPISLFAGGKWEMAPEKEPAQILILPQKQMPFNPLASGSVRQMAFADAQRDLKMDISLDRVCPVTFQDNRIHNSPTYAAVVEISRGPLSKGKSVSLQAVLRPSGRPRDTQVMMSVNPVRKRYSMDGFGGNYCFGIDSPISTYTVRNLRVNWARTEMLLKDWEPENDNAKPSETNWEYFKSQDKPGSALRRRFLFDQYLSKRGIRTIASIWQLPRWLYLDPDKKAAGPGQRLDPAQWPELLECIGSYLIHAKREYAVEPDLLSFNEADIGVNVQFSAEEHRDMIKRIGSLLKKLGLKTRMLLADTHSAQDTQVYAQAATNDVAAMSYVGAIAFHSWNGASPEQYKAWGDLAGKLRLPLLVTELGVDPQAWQTGIYDTFQYGLREARMYQEILLHARPQGILYWEYTSDYRLLREQKSEPAKTVQLTPTTRFWFVKHFSDLTPPKPVALMTASNRPEVLFTAFSGSEKDSSAITLHVLNCAAGRKAVLFGLPAGLQSLRAIRTSETDSFKELPPVPVKKGSVELELTPRSLLTLTSLPP